MMSPGEQGRPGRLPPLSGELARVAAFGVVGVLAFLVYLATVTVVVELGGHPVAGAILGFATGTTGSFVGNCRWVFRAPASAMVGKRFVATTLVGFGANVGLAWLLTAWGVHYIVMTLVIFSIIPVFNYLGHRFWTFGAPRGGGEGRG